MPFRSPEPERRAEGPVLAATAGSAALVGLLDLGTELGIASPVLYGATVAASYFSRRRIVLHAALGCSLLTLAGFFGSEDGARWYGAVNRVLALGVIWLTALFCLRAQSAQNGLAQALARHRSILDAALDAVIAVDEAGRVTEWNPQASRSFGWRREEALGRRVADLIVPAEQREVHTRGPSHPLAPGEGFALERRIETVAQRRDGTKLPVEVALSAFRNDGRSEFSGFVRDLTEQKRAEELFRSVVESSPAGMVMIDASGTIVLVNAEAEGLFGYGPGELLGAPIERLVPERFRPAHPAHRSAFLAAPVARRMGGPRDLHGLRKNGSEFPVEIGLNPISRQEGVYVLGAVIDVTERVRARGDLERTNRALESSNRALERSNEDLDQFAYSASHDLRAPLRSISHLSSWLVKDHGDELSEAVRGDLARIRERIAGMEKLLDDLLHYARVVREDGEIEEVDCVDLVGDLVELLAPPEGVQVEIGALPTLRTARVPLEQVLRNLIGNAIEHHPGPAGRVSVSATLDAGVARFEVEDDGPGIAPRYHERIFAMFQTVRARRQGKGSGMGLALVKRIVTNRGGSVGVESGEGEGARFWFTWPLPEPEKEASS